MTATIDAPDEAQPQPLNVKFDALRNEMNARILERADVIDTMLLAIVSRTHHFQLGEPGVAKSLGIETLARLIDGLAPSDYFRILMTKFTTSEEVFGPLDLAALKDSRYRHMPVGYLPAAKFAFVDEAWKANSPILNAFLWAFNERQWRNDGQVEDMPLWSAFLASNELPEGEELNAIYDRIHFRHEVKRIQEQAKFIGLLKASAAGTKPLVPVLHWDDVVLAHQEAMEVELPADVYDAMNSVRNDLRSEGIEPTDRRFAESLRIVKAAAWMDGLKVADVEHVQVLQHVLWSTPDEIGRVEGILMKLANPLDQEAQALLDRLDELDVELDKLIRSDADAQTKARVGVELHNKLDTATVDLQKLHSKLKKEGRRSSKVMTVKDRITETTTRIILDVFKVEMPENFDPLEA